MHFYFYSFACFGLLAASQSLAAITSDSYTDRDDLKIISLCFELPTLRIWAAIASKLSRTTTSIRHHYHRKLKARGAGSNCETRSKVPWTREEDESLMALMDASKLSGIAPDWSSLSLQHYRSQSSSYHRHKTLIARLMADEASTSMDWHDMTNVEQSSHADERYLVESELNEFEQIETLGDESEEDLDHPIEKQPRSYPFSLNTYTNYAVGKWTEDEETILSQCMQDHTGSHFWTLTSTRLNRHPNIIRQHVLTKLHLPRSKARKFTDSELTFLLAVMNAAKSLGQKPNWNNLGEVFKCAPNAVYFRSLTMSVSEPSSEYVSFPKESMDVFDSQTQESHESATDTIDESNYKLLYGLVMDVNGDSL